MTNADVPMDEAGQRGADAPPRIAAAGRTRESEIDPFVRGLDNTFVAILVLVSIWTASICLLAANSRVNFLAEVEQELKALESRLAAGVAIESPTTVPSSGPSRDRDQQMVLYRIELLDTIRVLRSAEAAGDGLLYMDARLNYLTRGEKRPGSEANGWSGGAVYRSFTRQVFDPELMPTDGLLVILICATSSLGALVAGMRSKQLTSMRDLSLGLASGFIVFLAVKGGKFLFLSPTVAGNVPLNPFGIAFVGVLVGLYVERAYAFLNRLLERFERTVFSEDERAAPSANAPKPQGRIAGASPGGAPRTTVAESERTPAEPAVAEQEVPADVKPRQ